MIIKVGVQNSGLDAGSQPKGSSSGRPALGLSPPYPASRWKPVCSVNADSGSACSSEYQGLEIDWREGSPQKNSP